MQYPSTSSSFNRKESQDRSYHFESTGDWAIQTILPNLKLISQSLDVKESDITSSCMSHADMSTAFRDMWARPLLFEMALYDPMNIPIHERILGEWRGLLAMR